MDTNRVSRHPSNNSLYSEVTDAEDDPEMSRVVPLMNGLSPSSVTLSATFSSTQDGRTSDKSPDVSSSAALDVEMSSTSTNSNTGIVTLPTPVLPRATTSVARVSRKRDKKHGKKVLLRGISSTGLEGSTLSYHHLSYTVIVGGVCRRKKKKQILNNIR